MFFVSLMTKFKHKIPEPRRSHLGVDLDEPLGRSANFRLPVCDPIDVRRARIS